MSPSKTKKKHSRISARINNEIVLSSHLIVRKTSCQERQEMFDQKDISYAEVWELLSKWN